MLTYATYRDGSFKKDSALQDDLRRIAGAYFLSADLLVEQELAYCNCLYTATDENGLAAFFLVAWEAAGTRQTIERLTWV